MSKTFKSIFKKVRNTFYQKNLYDETRHNKILDAPRDFERDPEWLRILDPDLFREFMPNVLHHQADYLEEIATYVHKSAAEFKFGRFKTFTQDIMNLLEEKGLNPFKVFQEFKVKLEDFNFYELMGFLSKELNVDIIYNEELGLFTVKDVNIMPYGNDWEKYKKPELRVICKSKGLHQTGTMDDLIERLIASENLE